MPGEPGQPGAPGINGTTGPSPRLLELVNGGQYENGGEFIDYAYYRTNDVNEGWYTVNVVNGVRTVVTYTGGVPTEPTWRKAPFQKEMSFGTVIAEQANIAGFKFRNQILESQHTVAMASCHPTPGVHLPKLQLNGLQGIINFLDRMIMDESGITLKDNCGRPRMVFKWENGIPILRFLDDVGKTTWEAGEGGYQTFIIAKDNSYDEVRSLLDTSVPLSATPTTVPANIYKERFCKCGTTEYGQFFGQRDVIGMDTPIIGYVIRRGTDILTNGGVNPIPRNYNGKFITNTDNHESAPPTDGWYIESIGGAGYNQLAADYFKLVNGFITARETVIFNVPDFGSGSVFPCGTHGFPAC